MKCTVCGSDIPSGNKFCGICGTKVPEAETTKDLEKRLSDQFDRIFAEVDKRDPLPAAKKSAARQPRKDAAQRSQKPAPPPAGQGDNKLLYLTDPKGRQVPHEFLDLITYKGKQYVVLMPVDAKAQDVLILRVENAGDHDSYTSVMNPFTLNAVFAEFKKRNKGRFNFG